MLELTAGLAQAASERASWHARVVTHAGGSIPHFSGNGEAAPDDREGDGGIEERDDGVVGGWFICEESDSEDLIYDTHDPDKHDWESDKLFDLSGHSSSAYMIDPKTMNVLFKHQDRAFSLFPSSNHTLSYGHIQHRLCACLAG